MNLILLNYAHEKVAELVIADGINPPEVAIHKTIAYRLDAWSPEQAEYEEVETVVVP